MLKNARVPGTESANRSFSAERGFDVICAGETAWRVISNARASRLGFEPDGGAVKAAVTLARNEMRVGLATVLTDDALGRALFRHLTNAGVDTSGVVLTQPSTRLFFVSGGARQV